MSSTLAYDTRMEYAGHSAITPADRKDLEEMHKYFEPMIREMNTFCGERIVAPKRNHKQPSSRLSLDAGRMF